MTDHDGLRVLLVEDDTGVTTRVRDALSAAVREQPFQLEVLPTLAAALERAVRIPFDVLILDVRLGVGWPAALLGKVRARGIAATLVLLGAEAGDGPPFEVLEDGVGDALLTSLARPGALACAVFSAAAFQRKDALRRVTEEGLKESRKALAEAEKKYRNLFDGNPFPLYVYDTATLAILELNEAAVEFYGYTRQQLLSMTMKDLRPDEDVPALLAALEERSPSAPQKGARRHRKNGGAIVEVDIRSHELELDGRPARLVLVRDVAEQRKLEQQLVLAQKMEAVGRLAGGIAHDFNNLLTVILGHADLLLERMADDAPQRGEIDEIRRAGKRAASLTRQLLAFSRRQVIEPRVFDVNTLVKDTGKMLRRVIGEDIRLNVRLDPDAGQIKADPSQLEQVLLNLAVNSRDAMPDGGTLEIETHRVPVTEDVLAAHPGVAAGDYVVLSVRDTGGGMDAETLSHVFEPFFTTKAIGKGTGLGLATVYGIVNQAGGHVRVASETARGTTFLIYLPRTDEEVRLAYSSSTLLRPRGGSESILLVEDEESVRYLARQILQAFGYRVLDAGDAAQALAISSSNGGAIALTITDVIMPGVSGPKLVETLRGRHPRMRFLFISGYTDGVMSGGALEAGGTAFLQKPFTSAALLQRVREVLEES